MFLITDAHAFFCLKTLTGTRSFGRPAPHVALPPITPYGARPTRPPQFAYPPRYLAPPTPTPVWRPLDYRASRH